MAILVTGGVGFVGVNIVKRFAEIGERVLCVDRVSPDEIVQQYVVDSRDRITFVQGDLRDNDLLFRMSHGQDISCIIHAAAITATHPDIEKKDFYSTVQANILGTMNILELAKSLHVSKLIYVSSGSAYGPRSDPEKSISEDSPLVPRRLYPITKLACELICRRYSQIHQLKLVILRLSSPYGPMERKTSARQVPSAIHDYVHGAVRGMELLVSGLDRSRDYSYIDDVMDAFVKVFELESLPHEVYNISSGVNYRLSDVIETLKKHIPSLKYTITDEMTLTNINEDTIRGPLDISRARNDFGFNPHHDLDRGIGKYILWLRKNKNIMQRD